jgi:hypothetical protein
MTHDDPCDRRPPPQPSAKPPRDEDHFDERLWIYGSVIAVIIAAVAIIGAVIWVFHGDHQAASRPQTQVTETTGQSLLHSIINFGFRRDQHTGTMLAANIMLVELRRAGTPPARRPRTSRALARTLGWNRRRHLTAAKKTADAVLFTGGSSHPDA